MRRKLTAAFMLIGCTSALAGCGTDRLALSQVPQGVSRQKLSGTPVIAFRQQRDVRVFIADVHHMEGEGESLVWCPRERLVVAKTHGEAFDEDGLVVAGPASRGLDEVPVEFSRGYVVPTGSARPGAPARPSLRDPYHGKVWDKGPGTFCHGMQEL